MALADRLARGLKASLVSNVVSIGSTGLLIIALTRVLFTPRQYGQLNFALSVFGVLAVVSTAGLPKSAARYVTEFGETAPGQVPHVLRRASAAFTVPVLAVGLGTALVGGAIARSLGAPEVAPYVVVGAGLVVLRAYANYFSTLFQGFNRVTWTAVLNTIEGVGRVVFAIGLVVLGFGVTGALAGYALADGVAAGVGGAVLYWRFYRSADAASSAEDGLLGRILSYSVPLGVNHGANVLDKKMDVVLVGVLLNVTSVGYYTVAKQVSDFVSMPASSLGYTISPAIAEQKSGDAEERASALYERALRYVLLAYVPATVGLVLVAGPMVRYVFGPDYLPAVPVVQVYSGFVLVNAINKVTSDGLDYLGRARSRAVVRSTMAVGNFLLNLVLIPWLGVVGASIATVVTYVFYTGSNVYFIHQELGVDVAGVARSLGATALVTAAMAAVVGLALPYVSGIATLLGAVGLGVATWGGLSVAGGLVDVRRVARLLA